MNHCSSHSNHCILIVLTVVCHWFWHELIRKPWIAKHMSNHKDSLSLWMRKFSFGAHTKRWAKLNWNKMENVIGKRPSGELGNALLFAAWFSDLNWWKIGCSTVPLNLCKCVPMKFDQSQFALAETIPMRNIFCAIAENSDSEWFGFCWPFHGSWMGSGRKKKICAKDFNVHAFPHHKKGWRWWWQSSVLKLIKVIVVVVSSGTHTDRATSKGSPKQKNGSTAHDDDGSA